MIFTEIYIDYYKNNEKKRMIQRSIGNFIIDKRMKEFKREFTGRDLYVEDILDFHRFLDMSLHGTIKEVYLSDYMISCKISDPYSKVKFIKTNCVGLPIEEILLKIEDYKKGYDFSYINNETNNSLNIMIPSKYSAGRKEIKRLKKYILDTFEFIIERSFR